MAGQKRNLTDASSTHKRKKTKTEKQPASAPTSTLQDELDFPRGGGSSLSALEVKSLRFEAAKEADAELFKVIHIYSSRPESDSSFRRR